MIIECPNCSEENAYLFDVDDTVTIYLCPDCDYKWEVKHDNSEDDQDWGMEESN